jgi:O-antigen ligase
MGLAITFCHLTVPACSKSACAGIPRTAPLHAGPNPESRRFPLLAGRYWALVSTRFVTRVGKFAFDAAGRGSTPMDLMRRNNAIFTFLACVFFPWVGTVLSFLVNGAGLWAVIRLSLKHFRLQFDRHMLIIAALFGIYFLSGLLLSIAHFGKDGSFETVLNRIPYLFFLPLLSRYSLSSPSQTRHALENGALVGAAIAAAFALVHVSHGFARAEAYSGNPGPFATGSLAILIILLNAAFANKGLRRRLFAIALILPLISLAASGMRTYWLVVPIVAAMALFSGHHPDRRTVLIASVLAVIHVTVMWFVAGDAIEQRVLLLLNDYRNSGLNPDATTSLGQHLSVWTCAIRAIGSSPILGLGSVEGHAFMADCTNSLLGTSLNYSHYHNVILTSGVFGGIVDIVATLAMACAPFVASFMPGNQGQRRSGVFFLRATALTWLIIGFVNLSYGHDIMDSIYIFMTVIGAHFCFAPQEAISQGSSGMDEQSPVTNVARRV